MALKVWQTVVIIPMHKKGYRRECNNYWGTWASERGREGHRRTGKHFTGGAEKVCLENNNLP